MAQMTCRWRHGAHRRGDLPDDDATNRRPGAASFAPRPAFFD
ncbi:hypothetical protein LG3211_3713 [Lysobacter gummosus]|nr:hypothetical protein LG3211_3713 [Lysobacter gummosus]